MIPENYLSYPTFNINDIDEMSRQMMPQAGMHGSQQFLVPGITPGTMSPGGFGAPSAGSPHPLMFGTNLPPQQAAQLYGQTLGQGMAQGTQGMTGMPGMQGMQGMTGMQPVSPFEPAPGSPTTLGIEYMQGLLRTQIGQNVRIEFLLGTGTFQDRRGRLVEVGIDHVVIREQDTDDLLLCDMYSIKFVTFFR